MSADAMEGSLPASGATTHHYPKASYAWYAAMVLLLVATLGYTDRSVLAVLVQDLREDLGINDTQIGILVGPAFLALYLLVMYPVGYLADRHSRRNVLLAGLLLWSAAAFASAFAHSYGAMLAARLVVGIGEATIVPCVFSMVADYFPPQTRGRATATVAAGIGLGVGVSMFGGGALLSLGGHLSGTALPVIGMVRPWQFVFVALGLVGAAIAALLLTVREPARQIGIHQAQTAAGSGMALSHFLRANAGALLLITGCYISGVYVMTVLTTWIPAYFIRHHGYTAPAAAYAVGLIAFLVMPSATFFGGILGDREIKRRGDGRFRLALFLIPGFIPAVLMILLLDAFWALVGVVLGLGVGAVLLTMAYSSVQEIVPNQLRGRLLSLYQIVMNVFGVSLGSVSVGVMTDRVFRNPAMIGEAVACTVLLGVVLGLVCCRFGAPGYLRMQQAVMRNAG